MTPRRARNPAPLEAALTEAARPDTDAELARRLELVRHITVFSPDRSTKVGAAITDPAGRLVVLGVNGYPENLHKLMPELDERPLKYAANTHGERGAIDQAARLGKSLQGCTITVTHPPCASCTAAIIAAGIKEVVIDTATTQGEMLDRWAASMEGGMAMFQAAGVRVRLVGTDDEGGITETDLATFRAERLGPAAARLRADPNSGALPAPVAVPPGRAGRPPPEPAELAAYANATPPSEGLPPCAPDHGRWLRAALGVAEARGADTEPWGAVLVGRDGTLITAGVNAHPAGLAARLAFPGALAGEARNEAGPAAIYEAARLGRTVEGATAYLTHPPTVKSATHLIAAGVRHVVLDGRLGDDMPGDIPTQGASVATGLRMLLAAKLEVTVATVDRASRSPPELVPYELYRAQKIAHGESVTAARERQHTTQPAPKVKP